MDTLTAMLGGTSTAPISAEIVALARAHRVDALLARTPQAVHAAPAVAARLRALTAGREALVAIQDRELRRVLDALADATIATVVIKGAHLAHAVYASPGLRPRADTDLVIAQRDQDSAASVLHRLGYQDLVHVRGAVILGQRTVVRVDATGVEHALDLHWRIAAPLVFKDVLPPDVLLRESETIAALGAHARGPSLPHAFLVACVHLVAHHRDEAALVWLYDIAAIVRAMDDRGVHRVAALAASLGVRAVCAAAVARARAHFDNPKLVGVAALLEGAAGRVERSARLLSATRPIDELWLDVQAAGGWRERVTLLKEHVWPDAGYMRATVGPGRWLPLAYASRAVRGAWHWRAVSASRRTAAPAGSPADSAAASARPPSRTSR